MLFVSIATGRRLMAMIVLDSPGPAFFRQQRLGKDGKPFWIIKFRTMVEDAEQDGPQWASQDDPRITRVGRMLRKLRLDELPQLLNILRGEMSFIGPRPERQVLVNTFQQLLPVFRKKRLGSNALEIRVCDYVEQVPHYSYRLLVKPGMTGWPRSCTPMSLPRRKLRKSLSMICIISKIWGLFLTWPSSSRRSASSCLAETNLRVEARRKMTLPLLSPSYFLIRPLTAEEIPGPNLAAALIPSQSARNQAMVFFNPASKEVRGA